MFSPVCPVILCGGSGTRLWPLSRHQYPKQFSHVTGTGSLFQQTVLRFAAPGLGPPVIVTGEAFHSLVRKQMAELSRTAAAILVEPEKRDTAPAVLAAALWLARRDPDALMLVTPSDHLVEEPASLLAAVLASRGQAAAGRLVTFGITPSAPETSYGYLEPADGPESGGPSGMRPLRRFVEKPDRAAAQAMLAQGRCLWNAGIFLFRAGGIVSAFRDHAPEFLPHTGEALEQATGTAGLVRLAPGPWRKLRGKSLDYAIMEKSPHVSVMPCDCGWSDLGSWKAVCRTRRADGDGNVLSGQAVAVACRNTLLESLDPDRVVVGVGLGDLSVIAVSDAVLVAGRDEDENIRKAVSCLQERGASQVTAFPWRHHDWGETRLLCSGDGFRVGRVTVDPGHTAEEESCAAHWIVLAGQADATLDGVRTPVTAGSAFPVGEGGRLRLENRGTVPLVMVVAPRGGTGEGDLSGNPAGRRIFGHI